MAPHLPAQVEISIVIVDSHPIFRHGLRTLIEADPMLKVIGEANDGKSALAAVRTLQPDVVVLDIEITLDGLAVAVQLQEERLPVEPIFLTTYQDEILLQATIELGVKGFILKDDATSEVIECIKAVAAGETFFSPTLMGDFIARQNEAKRPPVAKTLTPTERRVLSFVAETMSNKQIAERMAISIRTVEHHRSNICAKLELSGRNSLLAYALLHKSDLS